MKDWRPLRIPRFAHRALHSSPSLFCNIFFFYLIFISSFCALISLDGVLEVHHASHHSDSGLHATYNLFGYLLPLTATSDFDDCVVHVMYLLEDQKVLSDPEQAKRSRERRVSRKRRRREEGKRGGVPTLILVLFLFLFVCRQLFLTTPCSYTHPGAPIADGSSR